MNLTHSQEIFQIAIRAVNELDEAAKALIGGYLKSKLTPEGGFANKIGRADIYYSLFGLSNSCILQLNLPFARIKEWLDLFVPQKLGLIELSSLAKCYSILALINGFKPVIGEEKCGQIAEAGKRFKTVNHSFSLDGKGLGSPYSVFLAMNLYQDLGMKLENVPALKKALKEYLQPDGRFADPNGSGRGILNSTVAGLLCWRQFTGEILPQSLAWINGQLSGSGGFKADPQAKLPDMLSTAVALFALKICDADFSSFRERSQQFVADHWMPDGSFSATLLDEQGDCEYTYYGLLALGALSHV